MKNDYKKFNEKNLEDLLKDLKLQLIQSKVKGSKKKYNTRKIRREIARLLTEIRRRELQNKNEI